MTSSKSGSRAHPRSRGENHMARFCRRTDRGSSPLTRGKLEVIKLPHCGAGLIPAHAGKTAKTPPWRSGSWAHPRSRGENSTPLAASCAVMGSSPLTRGKLGNKVATAKQPQAHPRSRGENTRPASIDGWSMGSSPLTRGKQVRERVCLRPGGLIPAHAGKTVASMVSRRSMRAHPRSRGENCQQPPWAS